MDASDLIAFVEAVAKAFPEGAERDRFGRYAEGLQVERESLKQLAVKYKVGGSYDTQDQAGKVARAMLGAASFPKCLEWISPAPGRLRLKAHESWRMRC